MIFFESNSVANHEKHVSERNNHNGVPNIEKSTEGHYDEEIYIVELLSKPKFCFYFVILESF